MKLTNGVDIEFNSSSIDFGDVQISFRIVNKDNVKKFLAEHKDGNLSSNIPTTVADKTVLKTAVITADEKTITFSRHENETQVPAMAYQGLSAIVFNEVLAKTSQNKDLAQKISEQVVPKTDFKKMPGYLTSLVNSFPDKSNVATDPSKQPKI